MSYIPYQLIVELSLLLQIFF